MRPLASRGRRAAGAPPQRDLHGGGRIASGFSARAGLSPRLATHWLQTRPRRPAGACGPPFRKSIVSGSLSPDGDRGGVLADPHPAVLRVARRRVLLVLLAKLRQLVGLDRLPLRRG